MGRKTRSTMRTMHRYLGFFLAGIMAMYAVSGIVMIFRSTGLFKQETEVVRSLKPNLSSEELGKELRIKNLKVEREDAGVLYFPQGKYDRSTGRANYTVKQLPVILNKMTKLHKASTNSPVYWLNIFFGLSLLFFVISAFWMFMPKTSVFKKGVLFTLAGIVLTLVLLFV